MTLLLIIVLVLVLAGGGYGWRVGAVGANPIGLLLFILLLFLLFGLIRGPHYGWW